MIKINLARKRKAGGGGGGLDLSSLIDKLKGGGGGGGDGEKKKFDINGPLPKALMAFAACYLLDETLNGYRQEELAKVDAEIAVIEKEKNAILTKLAKIKGFEPIKKQLEEDEKQVRIKLDVVNKLLENRNAPAKIMMQIAQSIPEEVWLTDLKVTDKQVRLAGSAPGDNQVSDFVNALTSTSQFGAIDLGRIEESSTSAKEAKFKNFELTATRRQL